MQPQLGMGFYTWPEAARIIRVPPSRLRRWVRGYSFDALTGERFSPPVLRPCLGERAGETLTFPDLIQLLFVDLFRKEGVSMPTIRAAAAEAARIFGSDHPFTVRRFETDGRRIFATLDPEHVPGLTFGQALEDLALGQMVIEEAARPYFRKLDYDHDSFTRYWPLGKERHVVLDRRRAFGQPIDAASGVPTKTVFLMARAGNAPRDIAEWYRMSEESVYAAMEYEESLLKA